MSDFFEYVGAVHLHSQFSDGSLPIPEIAEIAVEKNLDFLMFSDHNTLEPKRQGLEGWYDSVLVMIGCELNDKDDRNHYLAFRINEEVQEEEAEKYVKRVRDLGGFGVIAHPAEKRNFSEAYPPYPWTAWDVDEFDGIEIWNQLSEWMEGLTRRNQFWRMIHPLRSIRFPVWETLERWDNLNKKRRVVGLGGIDVHAFHYKFLGFIPMEIYPYKVQFRSIRSHILTLKALKGETKLTFQEAEKIVFEAISRGRLFISNFRVGDARGFRFWAKTGQDEFAMGSRIKRRKDNVIFYVQSPLVGEIHILKDGQIIRQKYGRSLQIQSNEEGVYRVEIYRKNRGWIYSNPIVIHQ